MVSFTGGTLNYELVDATLSQLADALNDLATIAAQTMGPDDTPSSVEYDGETLTVGF